MQNLTTYFLPSRITTYKITIKTLTMQNQNKSLYSIIVNSSLVVVYATSLYEATKIANLLK